MVITIIGLIAFLVLRRAEQRVPIRYAPQIDPATEASFEGRHSICKNAPYEGGILKNNDDRRPIEKLFGTITSIEVHQFAPAFRSFVAVETYLSDVLAKRPRTSYRYQAWANGTPLSNYGVAGTLHFANGTAGAFEATTVYLCAQDSSGTFWWVRLSAEGGDLWPPSR